MEPSYIIFDNKLFKTNRDSIFKSHNIGNRFSYIDKTLSYDDIMIYKKVPDFKVSEITLYFNPNSFVYGFQVIYHNFETNEFFAGADYKLDKQNELLSKKTIKLDEDDYLISISGKTGSLVDNLRFETKKGKILEGGGPNGSSFEYKTKEGYYFSKFGGTISENDGILIVLSFEEMCVDKQKKNEIINFAPFRKIFKLVCEYLCLFDQTKIFMLNSHLFSLRKDPYVLSNITINAIKSVNNQHRRYVKEILSKTNIENDESYNYIISTLNFTSNKIKNPYGAYGLKYWIETKKGFLAEDFITQPYRTHCFAGTYFDSELEIEGVIKEFFNEEFYQGLVKGVNVIIAGGFIARRSDCPSRGYVRLTIYDENNSIIFKKKEKRMELKVPYQLIMVKYLFEKEKIPYKLKFSFGGKDLKFWAGNYGPRFSGLFLRGYKKSFFE